MAKYTDPAETEGLDIEPEGDEPVNPDHITTIEDEFEYVVLRDKDGNIVDPDKIELDPDWVADLEAGGNTELVEKEVGVAHGSEYLKKFGKRK